MMGCFCRNLVPLPEQPVEEVVDDALPEHPLITGIAEWLAARWLPAPRWEPVPEWQDIEWPDAPVAPEAMTVLTSLVIARQACQAALKIDPAVPEQLDRLRRIIGTLNRRTEQLQQLEQDRRPWQALAQHNAQIDMVRAAITQRVFEPLEEEQEEEEPLAPWRQMLVKVKALAPLVAVGQIEEVDFAEPEAVEALARTVRQLRQVELPELDDAPLLLRVIAQTDAIARLQDSMGADPRPHAFERVKAAIERKVQATEALMPDTIRWDGRLLGMPERQPNPTQLLNPATVQAARKLTPRVLDRLRWQVPRYDELPLLTVAQPVAALTAALTRLGPDPVRQSPCGRECDAATVMRALQQPGGMAQPGRSAQPGRPAQPGRLAEPERLAQPGTTAQPGATAQPGVTARPGSGTGARPAG